MRAQLKDTFLDIWDGIRSQPGRIGLAFLAILVGITALTILLAVLGGLEQRSQRIIQELGVNVFGIMRADNRKPGRGGGELLERHARLLEANLPGCAVSCVRTHDVQSLGTDRRIRVVATDGALLDVRRWRIRSGRFLDREDIRMKTRVAVVSVDLSRSWGWSVGDIINIRDIPFRVVGTIEAGGGSLDAQDSGPGIAMGKQVVFVPLTVPAYWLTFTSRKPGLDAIFVQVQDASRFSKRVLQAESLLAQPDQRISHISFVTPETLLRGVRRLQKTIKLTVGSIAILCLILGGTTLMSLMVANVRDRVVEIGLRRALGATAGDIASLFVWEACLVTASAALAGAVLTHVFLLFASDRFPVPVRLGLTSFTVPILVAVLLGVLFSYWPAKSAAMITPSDALRND